MLLPSALSRKGLWNKLQVKTATLAHAFVYSAAMELPRVDLGKLDLTAMDRACREWGSFVLLGHDIDAQLQQEALTQCQAFFTQPLAAKNRIRRSASNAWGFFDAELTKNRRDWKEIIDIGPAVTTGPLAGSAPQWPDLPGFRESMEQLSDSMHSIALTMVHNIARALQCQTDLCAPFAKHSSFLRLNYYPACPEPARSVSCRMPSPGYKSTVGERGILSTR